MKVYIGSYKNWFGPYQLAEKIFFWMKKEDDRIDKLGDRLANITPLCRFFDWFHKKNERKIKIRIDEYDTWNMDHTLALIALPMLKQLRASKHGAPFVDDEDVPEHLRSTAAKPKENEWDTDDNHYLRWDWAMDEMIYAFEKRLDDDWDMKIYKRGTEGWTEEKLSERKEIQKRISNGFRLFGKYYQALWD